MIEAIFYGSAVFGVVAALIGRHLRRKQVSAAVSIDAPVVQRRLIVTALLIGVAVMSALFAAMAVSLEAWPMAIGAAAVSAVFVLSLVLTRKPISILRYDGELRVLSNLADGVGTRIDLTRPIRLHSAIKMPAIRRSHPWMVVTVEQDATSISFCFPWELAAGVPSRQNDPLPAVMLDWRGAVIFERLNKLPKS